MMNLFFRGEGQPLFAKKLLFIIARGLVSISLLYYLFLKIDWERLFDLLSEIRTGPLITAPLIIMIGYIFSSVRWNYILEKFEVFSKKSELYVYYLIGAFYSIFLPGVVGGDIIRIGLCKNRSKSSLGVVSASVLVERVCGVIALFLMGSVVYFYLPPELTISTLNYIPVITILTVLILIVVFSIAKRYKGILANNNIINRFFKKAVSSILPAIKLPYSALFMIIFLSALFQAADIMASYTLAKVLNLPIPLSFFLS